MSIQLGFNSLKTYFILIIIAIGIYIFYSKIVDLLNSFRIKKGMLNKITLTIKDNNTIIQDNLGKKVFEEPNDFIFIGSKQKTKIIFFGDIDKYSSSGNKFENKTLRRDNFIKNFDEVIVEIDSFWYQFITYWVLRFKREVHVSSFTIVPVSIKIDVTSERIEEEIKRKFESVLQTNRPKLFNIQDIT